MGIKDILAAGVDLSKVDTGAFGVAQHGILGNKLLKEAKELQEAAKNTEKPGKYCDAVCPVTEDCKACVQMQEKFEQLMRELETMECAAEQSQSHVQTVPRKAAVKCTLCGAPYEQGRKRCSYCDTPYEAGEAVTDSVQSAYESEQLLKQKAGEVYDTYCAFKKLSIENRKKSWTGSSPKLLQAAVNGFTSKLVDVMELTPDQIYGGAKKYNMKLSAYIGGVIDGTIKSENVEKLEETERELHEYNRQQQVYYERNRQIEREKNEKLRKTNRERNDALGNLIYSKHVDWPSNEPTHECWSCRHYNIPAHICTRTNCSEDSSHCCIFWEH